MKKEKQRKINYKIRMGAFAFREPKASERFSHAGFALVELMIVIFIFLIIIFVAVDLFMSILHHQQRILNEQEILNQTSYAVEYMSRALRMAFREETETGACLGPDRIGYNYVLTHEGSGVKFINHSSNDICQNFFLEDGKIKEIKGEGEALPLTPETLNVNYFNVKIFGEAGSDIIQPRVTISMEIQARGSGDQPKVQIQTTISQRNLKEI